MKPEIFYSDLDMTFKLHPTSKDVTKSINELAIKRSLKNLILTNHYERLFQSEIGSNVNKMLFENFTPLTANYLQREIYDVITIFEPRVKLQSVEVEVAEDENAMKVTIQFYMINSTQITIVDFLLERAR